MHQSRSAGKRLAIGILVLKAPSVGNKARKQAVCHIGINRIAGKDQEIIDDDRAGTAASGRLHYNVTEFRAGGTDGRSGRAAPHTPERIAIAAASPKRSIVGTSTEMNRSGH